jgi:pimeloyl-ACP methyl ester carboxylesterase
MAIAEINGISINYIDEGDGEPLVFIPGLGGNVDLWIYQTRFFKKHFRTISLDNRGAGLSDKPEGPYSMEMFASDVKGLLDHLGISDPINLVGASMGGIIAQCFIHLYPKQVKRLALVCAGVSGGDPHITPSSEETAQRMTNPGETWEEKVNTILDLFYHPDFVRSNPQIRDTYLQRKAEPQPEYAYNAQLKACSDPQPYFEWLSDITVPTLVIHGEDDLVFPKKNAETLMEGLRGKGTLYIMKRAGHILMQEKPNEFNAQMLSFMTKD